MIVDCTFKDVKWTFDGSAALTLKFMNGLYHGMGDEGKQLVEKTFENIRRSPEKFAESVSSISQFL
jgi:hypothetical protein